MLCSCVAAWRSELCLIGGVSLKDSKIKRHFHEFAELTSQAKKQFGRGLAADL